MAQPNGDDSRTGPVELARRAIALIDLTDLDDAHRPDGIDELCARAAAHGTAAVCVWPEFVSRCTSALAGTGVRVATVVNFPSGDEPTDDVVALTIGSVAAGADEIDVVIPWRAVIDGDVQRAVDLLDATRVASAGSTLKVIVESGELADQARVRELADLAIAAGAEFVKTSTGKTPTGATLDAAATILEAIAASDRRVGLKPSGGIRTLDDASAYLALADGAMGDGWATPDTFRFGASSLLDALLAVISPDVFGTAGR